MGAESPSGRPDDRSPDVDRDAGARGAVYGVLARCFRDPDETLHGAMAGGELAADLAELVDRTSLPVDVPDLQTDDGRDLLSARYNDLFVVGFSRVIDRTDGSVEDDAPAVPLYESSYRPAASWSDVNLDLARAYEHFGVEIDPDHRDHHDHLPLELEFAGYLCRREAAVDPEAAAARLDFHDRHLRVLAGGVAGRLDEEAGTGVYGELGRFLDAFTRADVDDLAARREGSS